MAHNKYDQYDHHSIEALSIYRHHEDKGTRIQVEMHTSCLKSKSGGKWRPFGRRALGSRSSSKKGWAHASSCNATIFRPE